MGGGLKNKLFYAEETQTCQYIRNFNKLSVLCLDSLYMATIVETA